MLISVGGFSLAVLILIFYFWPTASRSERTVRTEQSGLVSKWSFSHLISIYGQAWVRVEAKLNELREADEEKYKLRLENANLKLNIEALQFKCHAHEGAATTESYELKLAKETGARVGRSLQSIDYKAPTHLLPSQLYSLGIAYLNSREDEKAAVVFTSLTGLENNDSYKTAKNLLLTGVSWYRLENYTLADAYFDDVLKTPEVASASQYQAQARLWKALIAKKSSQEGNSQRWLKEVLEHHPHSTEANWINSSEVQGEASTE
jgi:hypothetical protein